MNKKYRKDELGTRMKGYETVSKTKLLRRMPVIIRLDGKAFHTWTRQLKSVDESLDVCPYSVIMHARMKAAAEYLMHHVQNAVIIYSQSDELSILLNDWRTLNTDQWFDASIQKMASISASIVTVGFNAKTTIEAVDLSPALFDARVFNVPKEEVANYFVWRQQDATRNSINMLAQFYFSHKQLQGKNISQVQDMLMLEYGINWNDIDTWKKRGFCITSNTGYDKEIPIFTKDRNYIEEYLDKDNSNV